MRQLGLATLGVAAVALAMLGGRSELLGAVLSPPFEVRVMLGLAAGVIGLVLLLRSADRIGEPGDPRTLIRAVRTAFLAVGAFAAAAGWLIGSPVPIVAALVICGVDVLETTFLLVVAGVPAGVAASCTGDGAAQCGESGEAATAVSESAASSRALNDPVAHS
jgi:hypothetical protein